MNFHRWAVDVVFPPVIFLASCLLARLTLLGISSMWAERLRQLRACGSDLPRSLVSVHTRIDVAASLSRAYRKAPRCSGSCCEPAAMNLWPNHRESGISEWEPRLNWASLKWPQASYLTFACSSFSSCKMGEKMVLIQVKEFVNCFYYTLG